MIALASIDPKSDPKYSPNLYAWMKRNYRKDLAKAQWFTNEEERLYIGDIFDGDLLGSSLNSILNRGGSAGAFSFSGHRFALMPGFWDGYIALGRCFLDPKHGSFFLDKRWRDELGYRVCLWCGRVELSAAPKVVVPEMRLK